VTPTGVLSSATTAAFAPRLGTYCLFLDIADRDRSPGRGGDRNRFGNRDGDQRSSGREQRGGGERRGDGKREWRGGGQRQGGRDKSRHFDKV
jgi:hypothetical protein